MMRNHLSTLGLVLLWTAVSSGCTAAPPDAPDDTTVQDDPNAEPNDGTELVDDETDIDPAAELAAQQLDDSAMEAPDPKDLTTPGLEQDDDDDTDDTTIESVAQERLAMPPNAAVAALGSGKIKYVLVLVKENHTFDNYFTGFPGATSSKFAIKWNGKEDVKFLRPFAPDDTLPTSPVHSHSAAVAAYRHGHMDGFSVNAGKTPYMRYREDQIPSYWKYAREFALADHFFSESLAPSSPGHEVFWFGRSTTIDNPKCHLANQADCGHGCTGAHLTATTFDPRTGVERTVKPCFALPSLPDHLPTNYTWIDYGGEMAKQIKSQRNVSADHYGSAHQLLADLKHGVVHNLMIAHLSGGAISEHPPEGPCVGERFSVDVINAAMQLPEWNHMAIIVTWDDWGGLYDHVRPQVHKSDNGAIYGRGFRLPLLIISPYAKSHHVVKDVTEQASVPRLVEELFGMEFMTTRNAHARDGRAGSLRDAFDFSQPPRPPMILPTGSCPGD
jgi:phospholipase C